MIKSRGSSTKSHSYAQYFSLTVAHFFFSNKKWVSFRCVIFNHSSAAQFLTTSDEPSHLAPDSTRQDFTNPFLFKVCSSDSEKLGSFDDSFLRHLPPKSKAGHAKERFVLGVRPRVFYTSFMFPSFCKKAQWP